MSTTAYEIPGWWSNISLLPKFIIIQQGYLSKIKKAELMILIFRFRYKEGLLSSPSGSAEHTLKNRSGVLDIVVLAT
jgi:hypothetical protein